MIFFIFYHYFLQMLGNRDPKRNIGPKFAKREQKSGPKSVYYHHHIFFAPRARKVLFRPPVIWRKVTPAGGKVVFSPAPTQNQEGGKAVFSPAPTQNALGAKSFVQPSGGKCIFSPLAFLGTRSTRTKKPPRARKCIFRPRAVNSYYRVHSSIYYISLVLLICWPGGQQLLKLISPNIPSSYIICSG